MQETFLCYLSLGSFHAENVSRLEDWPRVLKGSADFLSMLEQAVMTSTS